MSRKPARVGEGKLQLLRDLLAKAGAEGLMLADLIAQLPSWSRTSIYIGINQLLEAGHSSVERQHPFAVHFAASVPEAERRATFERRMREERQRRGQAVRDGTEAHLQRQGRTLREATRLRQPVRAVDPHALRPDAVVTGLESVQVEICKGYRTKWERHAAEVKPPPLPAESPRPWVEALLAARNTNTEPRA